MTAENNKHPLYHIENLQKQYDRRTILKIDTLSIHRGEIIAILGPSGSGKSTLLRLLNFLEQPTNGKLYFNGMLVEDMPRIETRRDVTTVFQNPQLLNRSVRDNVEFGLKIRGELTGRKQVINALERVGLSGLEHNSASSLSGGELQRVALARALVLNTEALLLDEPTSNLDPYNTSLIESLITEHHQTHKSTIVLVTHNLFQARRLAQRCALLLDGQLIEVAPTNPFFEASHDTRVSAFVNGNMIYLMGLYFYTILRLLQLSLAWYNVKNYANNFRILRLTSPH